MGYTGLFTTEAIFVLVIALWFVRQLDWFSFLESIKDPKGILPPTITLLVGFIVIPNIVNFYNSLSKDNVILELLKSSTPLIAIFTFFLGQFTAIREKERDRKEQKKITAYKMLDSLDWLISNGGSLYCIEKKLEQAKPKDFDYSKFQSFCENQLIEIDSQLKEAQANEETFTIANERFLIGYFKRVKSFVEQIINNNFNEQDMVDGTILYLAEYHIITAYRHKLFLAQNIIKDPNLIEGITSDLQLKKTCLNYFIKRKNKIRKHYQQILHDYNSEMTEIEQMEGDYYFLEHDNDMESELIKEIDQIFNNFQ